VNIFATRFSVTWTLGFSSVDIKGNVDAVEKRALSDRHLFITLVEETKEVSHYTWLSMFVVSE
jgi:hypothetical protein